MKPLDDIKELINSGMSVEKIGDKRDITKAIGFAKRLGYNLPDEYFELIRFSDGLSVNNFTCWFSFIESIDSLIFYQDIWADEYWPISDDGCGNYYCLNNDEKVLCFETIDSYETPSEIFKDDILGYLMCIIENELQF